MEKIIATYYGEGSAVALKNPLFLERSESAIGAAIPEIDSRKALKRLEETPALVIQDGWHLVIVRPLPDGTGDYY